MCRNSGNNRKRKNKEKKKPCIETNQTKLIRCDIKDICYRYKQKRTNMKRYRDTECCLLLLLPHLSTLIV